MQDLIEVQTDEPVELSEDTFDLITGGDGVLIDPDGRMRANR